MTRTIFEQQKVNEQEVKTNCHLKTWTLDVSHITESLVQLHTAAFLSPTQGQKVKCCSQHTAILVELASYVT
jgi:hypothetical protein